MIGMRCAYSELILFEAKTIKVLKREIWNHLFLLKVWSNWSVRIQFVRYFLDFYGPWKYNRHFYIPEYYSSYDYDYFSRFLMRSFKKCKSKHNYKVYSIYLSTRSCELGIRPLYQVNVQERLILFYFICNDSKFLLC